MSMSISNVLDAGNLEKERVVVKVRSEDDTGYYALFQARASDEGNPVSGKIAHVYWFMYKKIFTGDLVVLYTKAGKRSEKKNDDQTTSHFFYWGLERPLWVGKNLPVLVSTPTWSIWRKSKIERVNE